MEFLQSFYAEFILPQFTEKILNDFQKFLTNFSERLKADVLCF